MLNRHGLSTPDTVYAIKKLLENNDIDLTDFVYSTKSNTQPKEE